MFRSPAGLHRNLGRSPQDERKVLVGICAMAKKTNSKAMTQILDRLIAYGEFKVIIFNQEMIFDKPIEEWPIVECFMGFFSSGFPLEKMQDYVRLRNPFCLNDVHSQSLLRSRVKVIDLLRKGGVPTLPNLKINRSLNQKIVLTDEYLEVDGKRLALPLVEKPWNADDHNINVLYGNKKGIRRLFRKIDNRSSEYDPDSNDLRTDGNYIYEPFLQHGKDLKVYTIGVDYAHGETRKSPTVDGVVERDPDNKELRLLTRLSQEEREYASKICHIFRQNICGFDMIRYQGKSYIIDVNGWSFVKGNLRYYDKCARIIRKICLGSKKGRAAMHSYTPILSSPRSEIEQEVSEDEKPTTFRSGFNNDMLRAMVVVFRHADRGPKHKVKWKTNDHAMLQFLNKELANKELENTKYDMKKKKKSKKNDDENTGPEIKLTSKNGGFLELSKIIEGIIIKLENKKVEPVLSSPMRKKPLLPFADNVEHETEPEQELTLKRTESTSERKAKLSHFESLQKLNQILDVLRMELEASKVQIKPHSVDEKTGLIRSCIVICKWGGAITHAGITQTKSYVPIFWDEMLRPMPPGPPDVTDDPCPLEITDCVDMDPSLTDHMSRITDATVLNADFSNEEYETKKPDHIVDMDLDNTEIADLEESDVLAVYQDPTYKTQRTRFMNGMKVYASGEARVHATARAFIAATNDEEDDDISVKLISDDSVMTFLDDISAPAKQAMMLAKNDVKKLMMSKVNYFNDADEKKRKENEKKTKGLEKTHSTAGDESDEDNDSLSVETLYQMRISRLECDDDLDDAPTALTLPLTSKERSVQFSMTKWGLRCLRWLNVPYTSLTTVYGLVKSLQHQLHLRLGLEWKEQEMDNIPETDSFEEYQFSTEEVDRNKNLSSLEKEQILQRKLEESEKKTRLPGSPPSLVPQYTVYDGSHKLCHGETLWSTKERWDRLMREFYNAQNGTFDMTKIPDIYDNIKYDAVHNRPFLQYLRPLYRGVERVADFVIPQEYGVLRQEKLFIGKNICDKLLDKIVGDLEQGLESNPRTRVHLHFSSESHLHSLRNILLLSGLASNKTVATTLESININYMSHAIFRLFEDESKPMEDPMRFYVNVQFSPGASLDPFTFLQPGHHLPVSRPVPVNGRVPFAQFKKMFLSDDFRVVDF